MKYSLAPLPYSFDALEPYIDARTMEIHYTKHHQTYVDQLNAALAQHPEVTGSLIELLQDLDKVPASIREAVRNNGGGHANHTFFWNCMAPHAGGEPKGAIGDAIQKRFGSFQAFQELLNTHGRQRFGSGWAWLALNSAGDLEVCSTPNQDSVVSQGSIPILGLDVWEHAYYLKYQNRRVDYMAAWWNTVNWSYIDEIFSAI